MDPSLLHDILADVGVVFAIILALWGFYWKQRGTRDDSIRRLVVLEEKVDQCYAQVSNHIPTRLAALASQLDELKTQMARHEAREEVYWSIVEKHISEE